MHRLLKLACLFVGLGLGLGVFVLLFPTEAGAFLLGSGFEGRMEQLTNRLVSVILPLLSILGLVYAVFLALLGDGAARSRIVTVIVCSVIGFLAPYIIRWFQSAAGP